MDQFLLKLTFISGLKEIVQKELKQFSKIKINRIDHSFLYLETDPESFKNILSLKSIISAYIVKQDHRYNPKYINKHKSLLGDMIEIVCKQDINKFKTYRLRCAGSKSDEILDIKDYIKDTYKLKESEESDLEIYINKLELVWEISVRLSPRPLSARDYKEKNIKGGLNPTVAFAMNSFCDLKNIKSYLNIFSGSGTLLIEAAIVNPNIKLIGLDIDKKTNSLAIQNIRKAGFIKNIQIKTGDILENLDLSKDKFDAITANLPFGMQVSKGKDLSKLYEAFANYSENTLNPNGKIIIYTTEFEILKKILVKSKFTILNKFDLTIPTSVNSYIYPKIFVCGFSRTKVI
jgi:tRNA G10  N-methylase Trm11